MNWLKVGKNWYFIPSLSAKDKEALGILDKDGIIKELSETPEIVKNTPCKKAKINKVAS